MSVVPEGLNPKIETREIVFDASVDLVTPFLKLATVSRGGTGHMTFASDEGPSLGGLGSAPTPLMYFSAALAFWLMTQVSRYGHMLKVTVNGMRMKVTARYRVDGSVLNDTIQGRMVGAETTLEIDSPDPPERVARVVRNAERGCFVLQALQNPVPVTGRTLLNGAFLGDWRSNPGATLGPQARPGTAPAIGKKMEATMATTLSNWTIDPVHSSVEFSIDYMGFSTYRTGFRALEGSLQFDADRPAASSVTASIPVASVDVTTDRLMSRLMDADLLGGKDHPTITFRSTRVEVVDPTHWKVTGDLTIHGVARSVLLDTQYLGQAMHPFAKKIAAGFRAETAVDRRDFGVTWNATMDTGGAYLGERVRISLSILALLQWTGTSSS